MFRIMAIFTFPGKKRELKKDQRDIFQGDTETIHHITTAGSQTIRVMGYARHFHEHLWRRVFVGVSCLVAINFGVVP